MNQDWPKGGGAAFPETRRHRWHWRHDRMLHTKERRSPTGRDDEIARLALSSNTHLHFALGCDLVHEMQHLPRRTISLDVRAIDRSDHIANTKPGFICRTARTDFLNSRAVLAALGIKLH